MNRDEILSNLADALELERELGVRSVEIDRELLPGNAKSVRVSPVDAISPSRPVDAISPSRPVDAKSVRVPEPSPRLLPLVFLHDKALSPKGVEMMAKIVTAMKLSPETAPILFTGQRPPAQVTVVLGGRALRAWFPGQPGAPGQWITPDGVRNVLVTYSPEYILRFGETPSVKKLKMEMWTSLKGAMQRLL